MKEPTPEVIALVGDVTGDITRSVTVRLDSVVSVTLSGGSCAGPTCVEVGTVDHRTHRIGFKKLEVAEAFRDIMRTAMGDHAYDAFEPPEEYEPGRLARFEVTVRELAEDIAKNVTTDRG